MDFFTLSSSDVAKNNQLAFDILEHEFGIPPVCLFYIIFDIECYTKIFIFLDNVWY